MSMTTKFCIQILIGGSVGLSVAYFFGCKLPTQAAAELIKSLGNLSAITGSLVGWSVSWISQSRSLIRDIDYGAARCLFDQLGNLQKELIWRWLIVLVSSIGAVAGAVIMNAPTLNTDLFFWVSSSLLSIAIFFVLLLFWQMLALLNLKLRLDEFERSQLKKQRLLPDVKES